MSVCRSVSLLDMLFTLLSDGRILKASTMTNPCKILQKWDMKNIDEGKGCSPFFLVMHISQSALSILKVYSA